ncbi:MAG: ATP-dependent DNA helicase RecG [Alphaproteobacteria bacterium]|nr:ATP-dependent DNA helicase RecG [Alphaproteobacteria bacterium]
MRPEILFPLFNQLSTLSGVGPKYTKLLEKIVGQNILSLYNHLPISILERRNLLSLAQINFNEDKPVILNLTIHAHSSFVRKGQPYKIQTFDKEGIPLDLVFFNITKSYLEKIAPTGSQRIVSGKIEYYGKKFQIIHPDFIVPLTEKNKIKNVEPIYPLTQGISNRFLNKIIENALQKIPLLPEWIVPSFIAKQGWVSWHDSIKQAHSPQNFDDLNPVHPVRVRLAYDEMLANQLSMKLIRRHHKQKTSLPIKISPEFKQKFLQNLPYNLTQDQMNAIIDIEQDMAKSYPMLRLLQGDVGSGKTIIAFFALLATALIQKQAVLLAPTEILATQHHTNLLPLAEKFNIDIVLLISKHKTSIKNSMLGHIAKGQARIIIGTHAVFQSKITFNQLAMVVIDEQHRFGVQQRLLLTEKGNNPHLLVMSATPIPRTLTMALYGDLDISILQQKPKGRQQIDTRVISFEKIGLLIQNITNAIKDGHKIYWICPLIQESDQQNLMTTEERYKILKEKLPFKIAMLHGQMTSDIKDQTIEEFRKGSIDILVATTLIEVGVDVPTATVMIIEHAERFGLAQLHQLRGRVGRGSKQSICILLYAEPLSDTAKARLNIMRQTNDGFFIAEEDLKLRGGGEILGTSQSGMPGFHFIDLHAHSHFFKIAEAEINTYLEKDPDLLEPRGKALRILLYLFEKDKVIKNFLSG